MQHQQLLFPRTFGTIAGFRRVHTLKPVFDTIHPECIAIDNAGNALGTTTDRPFVDALRSRISTADRDQKRA
ncbi:hypothetical protein HED55_26755 [Ochrobactrum haematophilum]|uniref:Uncharacterized protein n=1 Tax=Brucella haematophila TaxID=419474 RepID=A0ABX1DSF7_9HYPH|nr:hypothetical protein [Brucella haematophila]